LPQFSLPRRFVVWRMVLGGMLFLMALSVPAAHCEDVVLSWDRPNDARVAGYKIFYGLAESDFKSTPKEIINSAAQTACDIFDLKAGCTYAFAAKSTDGKGNESVFSEVLYYDVPSAESSDKEVQTESSGGSGGGGGGGCFIQCSERL